MLYLKEGQWKQSARLFITISVLVLLMIVGIPRSRAEGSITVSQSSTDSKFRESFTFHITASSTAGNIIAARVVTKNPLDRLSSVFIADPFTPAPSVDLRYTWDTRNETTPPFEMFQYHWEITDDAGNTITTPSVDAEMTDNTHTWQSLSDGSVRVYWYGNTDAFGKLLLDSAQQGFSHVSAATGYKPTSELRVVMYPDEPSFMSIFPSVEKVTVEWIGGETFGTLTVQWNEGSVKPEKEVDSLKRTVPHELAHAFLFARMGGRDFRLPSWFNEGQAVNNQIIGVDTALANARKIASENRLLRLSNMESHSLLIKDYQDIVDWYDTATSLVAFLYDQYGVDVLGKIVTKINDGARFEEALKSVTGLTLVDYEKQWRAWLGAAALSDAELAPTPTFEMPPFPPTPDYSKP